MEQDPVSLLLVARGRLARLPYFVALLALNLVAGILFVASGLGMFVGAFSDGPTSPSGGTVALLCLVVMVATLCGYLYSGAVVTIKRLHDIGWNGWHTAWIFLAGFVGGTGTSSALDSDPVTAACFLVWLAASVWLLLAPGKE